MSSTTTPSKALKPSSRTITRHQVGSSSSNADHETRRARVGVIGAGIAGLTAALLLAEHGGIDVDLFEASAVAGGRANVIEDAEHCQRIFLSDYDQFLAVLKRIPSGDGRSVADTLRVARRLVRGPGGHLVRISHQYYLFASEFTVREKLRLIAESRRSVLAARRARGPDTNFLGAPKNRYRLRTKVAVLRSFIRNQTVLVLPGRTDRSLTDPWLKHLRAMGVRVSLGVQVTSMTVDVGRVELRSAMGRGDYDAVVCTGFVADLALLLDSSHLQTAIPSALHAHCVCHTIHFAKDERSPHIANVALVSAYGLGIVVQPAARRCTVLCIRSEHDDAAWVTEVVAELLDLTSAPAAVLTRANLEPSEALYVGEHVDVRQVTNEPRIAIAGSWTLQRYPVDSGEAAVQSAVLAVQRITALVTGGVT